MKYLVVIEYGGENVTPSVFVSDDLAKAEHVYKTFYGHRFTFYELEGLFYEQKKTRTEA
jgi:hypothetical protein